MKEIKPYTPTKRCPHRYCRTVHSLLVSVGTLIICVALARSPLLILGMILFVTVAVAISALVHKRTMKDQLTTGSITDDLKPTVPLVVRPGWAVIALGMDVLYLLNGSSFAMSLLVQPAAYQGSQGLSMYLEPIGLAISVLGVWFITYAHKKATEPASPKFVTVPEAA